MNSPLSTKRDRGKTKRREARGKKLNVQITASRTVCRENFREYEPLQVVYLKSLRVRKELFVSYDKNSMVKNEISTHILKKLQ